MGVLVKQQTNYSLKMENEPIFYETEGEKRGIWNIWGTHGWIINCFIVRYCRIKSPNFWVIQYNSGVVALN